MIVLRRPPLDLALIAAYNKLRAEAEKQRLYYTRVVQQVDTIVGRLSEEHCIELLDKIELLQRELRLITKGTPITEALTPEDRQPILTSQPGFSQRQYDAQTQVLKRVYRRLAMLCHPDREGGDQQVFNEVETAYAMRDINRLNAIYLSIVQGRNLYWQQSDGLYHVSSEYHRYGVELEMLQQTAGWTAARLYMSGQVNNAVTVVHTYLVGKIAALLNEINYVNTKGQEHGQERAEGREIGERQIEEEQGADAVGESTFGESGR